MFNTDKFIDLADTIYRDRKYNNEASIRTALSRPYIATLSKAKNKLEEKKVTLSTNKELHKSIVDELKNYDNKLADKLEELNDFRVDADFNLSFTPDKEIIPFVTAIAKSFNRIANSKL